ncbi:unnamed protein product [Amoebophrya sp. A120]|nr:unnamed protein product [Amoebophrya sp. A120]|eukprot:GSA120T00006891001.1
MVLVVVVLGHQHPRPNLLPRPPPQEHLLHLRTSLTALPIQKRKPPPATAIWSSSPAAPGTTFGIDSHRYPKGHSRCSGISFSLKSCRLIWTSSSWPVTAQALPLQHRRRQSRVRNSYLQKGNKPDYKHQYQNPHHSTRSPPPCGKRVFN